ncbi:hypothetical protein J2W27_000338 [Variovorax boronicumulans]|uniref:hypothetical protein n=1 Tax=Variovorax boronicumulans TaxID=436515 RepID=UPI00278623BE|nr:hypothetical protein [Variovorax boronicumulans]MDP9908245.1 hypothetical protein [Variovorax boronicumulans]
MKHRTKGEAPTAPTVEASMKKIPQEKVFNVNATTSTRSQEAAAPAVITGITIPEGARAMLVTVNDQTGALVAQPVMYGDSVLNIGRDLLKHLNEKPISSEWLEELCGYCEQRLQARAHAQAVGGFITPSPRYNWEMTVPARRT